LRAVALAPGLTDPVPDPKLRGVSWFADTGHTLRGPFLDYWRSHGGLAQFGYPLTEEFAEPVGPEGTPYTVQYFERNRFEYHPENRGTAFEVLLGTLGVQFRLADPPAPPLPAPATYFRETGHNLDGAFRKYWETHGGLPIHGYPITEPALEKSPTDGKQYLVQWFERSRLELHPEHSGTEYELLLGLLGVQLVQRQGYLSGAYPPYGHAGDYSWLAGYFKLDPRKCAPCGCSTINFVSPDNANYPGARGVRPYGPAWDQALKDTGLEATVEPQKLIVVFGQLDDPGSLERADANASCLAPMYRVTEFKVASP
jgi:hypothetical protein